MAEHRSGLGGTQVELPDEAATLRLGGACAAAAAGGRTLHLRGELGAGKTTLVRGLLRALGYLGRVKSPTYALVEPYADLRLNLYHFDFYRIKDRAEWLSSGFREHFNAESLCVVEWPERAGDLLPRPDLDLLLEYCGDTENPSRRATLTAHSPAGEAWLAAALSRWRSS
ncbi:MAG: tRNA (adenosine(37)-N6)-threonylcarbamoyltransferase complex ATPase subunit type 1 TsaE [Burkholderiales bacterium]|nr:tRNA (adenosine(37)-N6)-threonylcarbamoyltransferase complex ATPase subunit type 1 TsaE [Burkholderiales bacterium]